MRNFCMPGLTVRNRALNKDRGGESLLFLWNLYLEEKVNCPIEFLITINEFS